MRTPLPLDRLIPLPKLSLVERLGVNVSVRVTPADDGIHDVADHVLDAVFLLRGILPIAPDGVPKALEKLTRLILRRARNVSRGHTFDLRVVSRCPCLGVTPSIFVKGRVSVSRVSVSRGHTFDLRIRLPH